MRHKIWKVAGAAVLLAGALAAAGISASDKNPAVFLLDGEPVKRDEYEYYLNQQKSGVFVRFGADEDKNTGEASFWDTPMDGITPMEYAREGALKACVQDKVILMLAAKQGLTEDVSFEGTKECWRQFVEDRKETTAAGGVVYGPVDMSYSDYRNYLISNLRLELKEHYEKDNPISDAELEAYYEECAAEQFSLDYEQELYAVIVDGDVSEQDARDELARHRAQMEEGVDADALDLSKCSNCRMMAFTADEMTAKGALRDMAPFLQACTGLAEGSVSETVYDPGYGYFFVQLAERKDGRRMELDEVKNRIRDIVTEARFTEYLDAVVSSYPVEIVPGVYDQTKME